MRLVLLKKSGEQPSSVELESGMIVIREELCPQNHSCPVLRSCPVNAISQDGYSAPRVDNEKCTCCCKCTKMCAVFTPIGCYDKGKDARMGI